MFHPRTWRNTAYLFLLQTTWWYSKTLAPRTWAACLPIRKFCSWKPMHACAQQCSKNRTKHQLFVCQGWYSCTYTHSHTHARTQTYTYCVQIRSRCEQQEGQACTLFGVNLAVDENVKGKRVAKFFRKACEYGDPNGCLMLSQMWAYMRRINLPVFIRNAAIIHGHPVSEATMGRYVACCTSSSSQPTNTQGMKCLFFFVGPGANDSLLNHANTGNYKASWFSECSWCVWSKIVMLLGKNILNRQWFSWFIYNYRASSWEPCSSGKEFGDCMPHGFDGRVSATPPWNAHRYTNKLVEYDFFTSYNMATFTYMVTLCQELWGAMCTCSSICIVWDAHPVGSSAINQTMTHFNLSHMHTYYIYIYIYIYIYMIITHIHKHRCKFDKHMYF